MVKSFYISIIIFCFSCASRKDVQTIENNKFENKTNQTSNNKRKTFENKDVKSLPVKSKSVNNK